MAVTNNAVVGVALNYLQAHPDETDDLRPLVLLALHGPSIVAPTTTPAHVICGVVAVTDNWQMLELHPSAPQRSRLPGGHVVPEDASLLSASLRLLNEQCGVPPDAVTPHAVLPLDVAVAPVEATGGTPEHVHFEVRFLIQVPPGHVAPPATGQSPGHRWVPVAQVSGRLGVKLRQAAEVRSSR